MILIEDIVITEDGAIALDNVVEESSSLRQDNIIADPPDADVT